MAPYMCGINHHEYYVQGVECIPVVIVFLRVGLRHMRMVGLEVSASKFISFGAPVTELIYTLVNL